MATLGSCLPCNLLIFPFPWLYSQALIVHLMHIARCLHIAENVILQVSNRLQGIRHLLVLLDLSNDFSGFGSLGEVDQVGLLDDRRNSVLDERQIREIDA